MLNFIRADFYRLVHTKSFWIAEAIISAMALISIVSVANLVVQMNDAPEAGQEVASVLTGYSAICQSLSNNLIYYTLPLIILVLGSEYAKGTLKNIITTGISRTGFFIGKFLSFAVILLLQIFWIVLISFVVGTISGGTGFSETNTFGNVVYYIFGMWIILLAISAVTLLALYLTKNIAVSVIVSIVWPLAVFMTHVSNPDFEFFGYIDFLSALDQVTSTTLAAMGELPPIFFSAIVIMILFLSLTNFYFNKQDL